MSSTEQQQQQQEQRTRIYTASMRDVIPSHGIHAGSLHGNRLAMRRHSSDGSFANEVFVAVGTNSIYRIKIALPDSSQVEFRPSKNANVPFPVQLQSAVGERVFISSPHPTDEIMEVKYNARDSRLGCVDARGRVYLFRLSNDTGVADAAEPDAKKRRLDETHSLLKPDIAVDATYNNSSSSSSDSDSSTMQFESGWAGLALHPDDSTRFATARFFHRDLTLFNGDRPERVIQLVQNPTQVTYISMSESHSPLLAVTEHNQLSIWDMRAGGGSSSCVARLSKSRGRLYDVTASCGSSNASTQVAIAGVDRCVYIFDSKRWTNRHTWQNCLKYSVSHLHFSSNSNVDNLIFASGFDNGELNVGNYRKNSKRNWCGMHADSRWIGMDDDSNDVIAGYTANSSVYVVENPHGMFVDSKKK